MTDERIGPNDLIPRWKDDGLCQKLEEWAVSNYSMEKVLTDLMAEHIKPENATSDQLLQFMADTLAANFLENVACFGQDLPAPITRPAAPTGLGMNADNVWFTPPSPLVGTWRWYVNGVLKVTQADYNMMARVTLGCVAGDLVQVCEVSDGVCGWWAKIVVT